MVPHLLGAQSRNNRDLIQSGRLCEHSKPIDRFLIRIINFNDSADVARHDKMVALVERMLTLHEKPAAAAIPADKQLYQRQTWGGLAEHSRPPTGRLTRWCTSCMG